MNFGELKQAILDDAHRPDLTAFVDRFVRECEGLLRRQLIGYVITTTLTDAERVSEGVYLLPTKYAELRSLSLQGRDYASLDKQALGAVRRMPKSADPAWYAEDGNGYIEIRGTPATGAIFDLVYFGQPEPFIDDTDTNTLLDDHETLYLSGAKFFLYQHTQDRELAQDALNVFNGVLEDLNEKVARQISGATIAPSYNFSGGSAY